MQKLLKEEYASFIETYKGEKYQGLRANTLKVPTEVLYRTAPFSLEPIPWVEEGFYYKADQRPGKHPYHEAGLYYIQEPSAMVVAEAVAPLPGEKILDLCAAPGGKTTQMAAKMEQQGLLVANEIHPARAKILSQNIERLGIQNAVVTNEHPGKLAQRFGGFFDRILVDAPCSGEGMFRKDPQACSEWSLENVKMCADRQLSILEDAAVMLRAGGRLVYSTCTFSPEENEQVIYRFIKQNPTFEVEYLQIYDGFGIGRPDWIPDMSDVVSTDDQMALEYDQHWEKSMKESIRKTIRLWPHYIDGEGHYLAVLRKAQGEEPGNRWKQVQTIKDHKLLKEYYQFVDEVLLEKPVGEYIVFGDQIYMIPQEMISLGQLKVVRPGWHLGAIKKNRFEPSHAFALSLKKEHVKNIWNMKHDSQEIVSYLKGETLYGTGEKGWNLVTVDGYSIGWGKFSDGLLKNHYPKGLRWLGNHLFSNNG